MKPNQRANAVAEGVFKDAGILLVDDEPTLLFMLVSICKQAGFRSVFQAENGLDALNILRRHSAEIDLISLDLMMPVMGGLKLAEIVANSHDRVVGLIVFTGHSDSASREEFFSIQSEVGLAEKYLHKPATADKLIMEYAEVLSDVKLKREKLVEVGVNTALQQIKMSQAACSKELVEVQNGVAEIIKKLEKIEQNRLNQTVAGGGERSGDLSYVWALASIFILISGGLIAAAFFFNVPMLSMFAVVSVAVVVLMLIAVLDLSKGGKLSEKSLMQVLRRAFDFIGRGK